MDDVEMTIVGLSDDDALERIGLPDLRVRY